MLKRKNIVFMGIITFILMILTSIWYTEFYSNKVANFNNFTEELKFKGYDVKVLTEQQRNIDGINSDGNNTVFSVKGKTILADHSIIEVFEFKDEDIANAQVKNISLWGRYPANAYVEPLGIPYFYKKGSMIVVYTKRFGEKESSIINDLNNK